ncbi:glutamate decarboxylase [Alicyclobacillus fastidiosus]|uniref:Glutamate decarboxylase n=1 Tax=Alicyclobacillus fastidiosus TaxID=392011 RepID=A0ABY6ZCP1_9BACL|nr:glutamate decarboxylase [Alicyclobacillus fastidiosus]WAH40026.1 glutamate decarboxylase [Alicyclobacillus fastidiosus]GMA61325.1 glutamate decarboxylase [Alicyclobacillus fastidiosus]
MPHWNPHKSQMKLPHELSVNPMFALEGEDAVPRFRMRDQGMLPETAYQIVHDEIILDGNARQNLATFVTTWMEPAADRLYAESFDKNMIDKDEYPQTAAIEERCVHILADLWHSPHPESTMGVSTTGSSEACMLAGLALKRRWQNSRKRQGKPIDRPNIVFSSAVQVVWEKFANYWDVEARYVNVTPDHLYMVPEQVLSVVDENTIAVVPILGVTYTGLYEPIAAIAKALDDLQARTGLDIPIHVDAASGGLVAPFLQPDLVWDFQLPRVKSINVSGHKYGLVYPGLGWVVWREAEDLPEDLIFRVSYLGGNMPTFALNFSRPGAQVLLQYYNFLRLGKDGYYAVQKTCQSVAQFLSAAIGNMGPFELFTDGSDIPVFAWRLKDGYTSNWNLYHLSQQLRTYGWQVPAYPMPPNMEDVTIMRVVVRNGFSMDLAHLFLMNLKQAVTYLDSLDGPMPHQTKKDNGFHH